MLLTYRPDYHLNQLRITRFTVTTTTPFSSAKGGDAAGMMVGEEVFLLRWLRTLSIDLRWTPLDKQGTERVKRIALQRRQAALDSAVEHFVWNSTTPDVSLYARESENPAAVVRSLCSLLSTPTTLPRLSSVDVRKTCSRDISDAFLVALGLAHPNLKGLYLPGQCHFKETSLNQFTRLEELHIRYSNVLSSVEFCGATLRVLIAPCSNLTDEGLRNATQLRVLDVVSCSGVTRVDPFAHCLLELYAGASCGIRSSAIAQCTRLQVLDIHYNDSITILPVPMNLKELTVDKCNMLSDATLASVGPLVHLQTEGELTTTVAPCAASLRSLHIHSSPNLKNAGLAQATNLVSIRFFGSTKVRSFAPFGHSLLEVDAGENYGIDSVALSKATNVMYLDIQDNGRVTNLDSVAGSLRHLNASCNCGVDDDALEEVSHLVTLDCGGNSNITTIEPFCAHLEELTALGYIEGCADPYICEMEDDCLDRAPNLRTVTVGYICAPSMSIRYLESNGFQKINESNATFYRETRPTRISAFHANNNRVHGHLTLSPVESACSVSLVKPNPPIVSVPSQSPTFATMPLPDIRSFARSLSVGQRIMVRFLFDGEIACWFGTVERKYQTALWPIINYDSKVCGECGEIASMEPLRVLLPSSGVSYLALSLASHSIPACCCSHDDSSEDNEFDQAEERNKSSKGKTSKKRPRT